MKKIILLPALGILSVALFSFTSLKPSSDGHIIHCDDGTTIIPSSVPLTVDDQNAIVSILSSYGPDNGYASYTTRTGETRIYNPTPVDVLASVDARYGSDLATASRGVWTDWHKTWTPTSFTESHHTGSSLTMAIHARLAPILAKYE